MDEAEHRISTLEDNLKSTQRALHRAEKVIKSLEAKTDDLENKGRRKNLVLLGLPEQVEGRQGNLLQYIQLERECIVPYDHSQNLGTPQDPS